MSGKNLKHKDVHYPDYPEMDDNNSILFSTPLLALRLPKFEFSSQINTSLV